MIAILAKNQKKTLKNFKKHTDGAHQKFELWVHPQLSSNLWN